MDYKPILISVTGWYEAISGVRGCTDITAVLCRRLHLQAVKFPVDFASLASTGIAFAASSHSMQPTQLAAFNRWVHGWQITTR
jgi:hypothetical protein